MSSASTLQTFFTFETLNKDDEIFATGERLDLITFLLRLFLYVDRKAAYMETRDGDLIDLIYFEGTLSFRARMFKFNRDTHLSSDVTSPYQSPIVQISLIFVLSAKD